MPAAIQESAGYAVRSVNMVKPARSGRRPTLSETAPITGNQNRFEMPTQRVTIRTSFSARCSALRPYVGV
jgi:hypothetical protein